MPNQDHNGLAWIDVLWLALLAGLAMLPPLTEIHKQMILVAIALFQIFEGRILQGAPRGWRSFISVFVKLVLASLLVWHTGEVDSSYYLIYFLPVVSAAMLYGAWGTILWTLASCVCYGGFLISALRYYRLSAAGGAELSTRYIFFFLIAVVVNRFVSASRRQAAKYQEMAGALSETNRRLLDAQSDARRSERLAALGQLSAGLAHEIRNPLGVIRGSAEMLSARLHSGDAVTGELAGYISTEVERLNSLVGRFLDFARPLRPKLESQQLAPVIERALAEVREQHPSSKVEIEQNFEKILPSVPLDGELAERIFINLFANAFEAMPDGGVLRLTLSAAEFGGRGGVMAAVEDTGPGIPASEREQIFNPFFTTKKTGVGLGLSIVSKIVDDHHGWIRLGASGRGACFELFFPCGNPDDAGDIDR